MVPEIWTMADRIILDHFLPFYLLTTRKSKVLKKMKKSPGDIVITLVYHNDNHMIYGSGDMERDE